MVLPVRLRGIEDFQGVVVVCATGLEVVGAGGAGGWEVVSGAAGWPGGAPLHFPPGSGGLGARDRQGGGSFAFRKPLSGMHCGSTQCAHFSHPFLHPRTQSVCILLFCM